MNFDLKEMNVNTNAVPNDSDEMQEALTEYDDIINNLESGIQDDEIIELIKPFLDEVDTKDVKKIARVLIQIDEGMNFEYGYPKSAINESEKPLEDTIYEAISEGLKNESLPKRVLMKPLLKKMSKALSVALKKAIGYMYQQVIPEMKQRAKIAFENGQAFQTDFKTISECSAYYAKLKMIGEYCTYKQAFEDAVVRKCTYYNRDGKQRQITEVSKLRKALDNINLRSSQEKYGLE